MFLTTKRREISKLSNEVVVLRVRLDMANSTIQTMKETSVRDWAMILRLIADARRRH